MSEIFYETIKRNSKKGDGIVFVSNQYHGRTLYDCYNKPSYTKQRIWDFWYNVCKELNPNENIDHNIHVCSYNCNFFSIGFETDTDWYYITPSHNYKVSKDIEK